MKKKLLNTCAATLLGMASVSSQASSIDMIATGSTLINVGDTVTFEIWADFSDVGGTIGGGLDMFYDSAVLSYNNDFAFDPSFPTDPLMTSLGDDCATAATLGCTGPGEIDGIAVGTFSFFGLAASGPTLVGSLSFTGAFAGFAALTMADNDPLFGSWFDNSTFGLTFPVYNDALVEVSAVPVPAAVWLFGSGLIGLAGVARRKKS